MVFEPYEIVIRESHLDTFGHVNNAAFLVLFEEARWEFITRGGYGLKQVQEFQRGPVILDLRMRFKKELILREKVKITMEFVDHRGRISRFRQEILKEDGEVAAELELTFGFFDLKTRRLIDPSPEWKKAIGLP